MSDTPETDDIARGNHVVPTEWAQQLERERDEAREKINRQANRIRYLEGATNHAKGTPLSVALRERDEARESLKHISEYGTDEINAAVELRQKLATALVERDEAREVLKRIAHASMSARHKEEDYAEWEKAVESLQGICEEKNFINE
jgi:hypothetical protein